MPEGNGGRCKNDALPNVTLSGDCISSPPMCDPNTTSHTEITSLMRTGTLPTDHKLTKNSYSRSITGDDRYWYDLFGAQV